MIHKIARAVLTCLCSFFVFRSSNMFHEVTGTAVVLLISFFCAQHYSTHPMQLSNRLLVCAAFIDGRYRHVFLV